MPNRAQAFAWIAMVGLLSPCPVAGQDRTDREVIELIVREGPQARAIRTEADVARLEQRARLAYPNPSFTYSREGAGFTEFYQAEQSLPIFGTRQSLSRAGAAATAAAEADRDGRLWLLRSSAAAAVARVVAEQARLDSARTYLEELTRLIEILRTREREGEGSRFDRIRAEQELRELNQLLTSATVSLVEARAALVGMLPREATFTSISASSGSSVEAPIPLDALLTRAGSTRAELRALQRSSERATLEAEAAKRAHRPAPNVFGGIKRADDAQGKDTGGVFGVSVALPFFDSGQREAARWEAERARVDAQRVAIQEQIRGEIVAASEVLAIRQAALQQEQQGTADELVQIAQVAYREGEVGILELLDAARTAARARNRVVDLQLTTRLAQIAVERAVGDTLWP